MSNFMVLIAKRENVFRSGRQNDPAVIRARYPTFRIFMGGTECRS
ncbi:hypothetical protein I546_5867 [Mycobacterium kansasii 732]|nr:hypothetical protein I546_5867 [Mycobacterium kansasii 732]